MRDADGVMASFQAAFIPILLRQAAAPQLSRKTSGCR